MIKVTLQKLCKWILEGRGVGTGDGYKAWIQITRGLSSPHSNQAVVPMPGLRRLCHFLSRGEREVAHVMWWLGAQDVREQFPLWPWPHHAPLSEIFPDEDFPIHPGLWPVAADAGIQLYSYPGLTIPAVPSLDLIVTLPVGNASHRLIGCSVKPAAIFVEADSVDRVRERLELDRRYCLSANMGHLLLHAEQFPRELVKNLDWLAPLRTRAEIASFAASQQYQDFVGRVADKAYEIPASIAASEAGRAVDWNQADATFAMHTALWRLDVDVDLMRAFGLHRPLARGGRALRTVLRQRLFSAPACN